MSSVTTEALLRLELSDGEIQCPVKGQLAIMRCEERQRETRASGPSCRCPVYEKYAGLRGKDLKKIPVQVEVRTKRPPRKVNTYVHDRQRVVMDVMSAQRGTDTHYDAIAKALGSKEVAQRILRMMVQEGRIERVGKALYRIAPDA